MKFHRSVEARRRIGWFLAVALLASGCGQSGPATYPVAGTVTFNGGPLTDGSIVFMSADNSVAPDAGMIRDGRFAFQSKPGKKKVEIRAVREVGKVIPAMGVAARESYLPAKYNSQTILTAEVVAGGANQFPFELKDDAK